MEALRPVPVTIDVTGEVSGISGPASIAVWVFLPNSTVDHFTPTVVFGFPGGTYTKSYFHLEVPDLADYSMANWLAERGVIFVACDHLGPGAGSDATNLDQLTDFQVVEGDRAIVEAVLVRLAAGTLIDEFHPILNPLVVGIGHSLGGYLTVQHQSRYESFDAIAVLGWSHGVSSEPTPDASEGSDGPHFEVERSLDPIRAMLNPFFYHANVPQAVRDADNALSIPMQSWMLQTGIVERSTASAIDASRITVPVFIGFADHDITNVPREEPRFYSAANEISLFVIAEAGHSFNFASARTHFFDRLCTWTLGLAR